MLRPPGNDVEPLRSAIRAKRQMGHASTLLGSAAPEEVAELGLGIEAHRHAAFAIRDRNGELIALAFVAAALLDESAWLAWMFSVVPSENLHRSTPRKQGRSIGEEKANRGDCT